MENTDKCEQMNLLNARALPKHKITQMSSFIVDTENDFGV